MRVGFENNVLPDSGDPADDNAALVASCRDVLGGSALAPPVVEATRALFSDRRLKRSLATLSRRDSMST